MDELDKGLCLSLHGLAKARALSRFQDVVRRWEVALPPVEPLVLDFGLGEFEKTGHHGPVPDQEPTAAAS